MRGGDSQDAHSTYRQRKVREVLEEDRGGLAEVVQPEGPDVMSTDEDLPFVRVIQPDNELEDRAFSGAVDPDNDLSTVQSS